MNAILIVVLAIVALMAVGTQFMWMQTMHKWQSRQDQEILKIYDHLKFIVERERHHAAEILKIHAFFAAPPTPPEART